MSEQETPYSLLSQAHRKKLSEIIPLEMPLSLYVDPSSHCNFHCRFCARNHKDYRNYAGQDCFLGMGIFRKLSQEIKEWGVLKSLKFYFDNLV